MTDLDDDEEEQSIPSQTFEEHFWDTLGTGGKAVPIEQLAQLAVERPITIDDIRHMISCYPYLDICNANVSNAPSDSIPAKVINSKTGWLIYDRGDRITAGPGRLVFGAYRVRPPKKNQDEEEDDDEGGGGTVFKGDGTITKQMYDVAKEVIGLINERWPAAEILGGLRKMLFAAWVASQNTGFALNYNPSQEEQTLYGVIKTVLSDKTRKGLKPNR